MFFCNKTVHSKPVLWEPLQQQMSHPFTRVKFEIIPKLKTREFLSNF